MLSGIGDSEELGKHGIPLVHHLPEVGQNLVDHLDITIMHAANSRLPIGVAPSFLFRGVSALFSYIFARRGFLTSNVAESGGFVKSERSCERPNVQFHFLPTYLKDHGRKVMAGYGYTLHICDLMPRSRGFIGLKSPDPLADPLIQPNYLSNPEDIKTMISPLNLDDGYSGHQQWLYIVNEKLSPETRCLRTVRLRTLSGKMQRLFTTPLALVVWARIRIQSLIRN